MLCDHLVASPSFVQDYINNVDSLVILGRHHKLKDHLLAQQKILRMGKTDCLHKILLIDDGFYVWMAQQVV